MGNITYYEAENVVNLLLLSSVFAPGHHKSEISVQNEAEEG